MTSIKNKRLHYTPIWVVLALALGLAACGEKEQPPPRAPSSPPAATAPAAPAPAEAVVDAEGGEAMLIQPSLVDTLSVDELLVRAEEAVKEKQLFVPAGESAFEMYLSVIEQEPEQVRARNALSDLFPYAMLYVEQRAAAGDLAESERVLDMMQRANADAPALPRLQRAVDQLRDRVAADAQRAAAATAAAEAAEARRQAADAAPVPVSVPSAPIAPAAPVVEPIASTAPSAAAPAPTAPAPEPVAAAPEPAAIPTPPPPPPPVAAAPVQVTLTPISTVQPRYPPLALRRRIEGSVEVGFTVMPDGSVSNVRILSSRPNNTFDREALNAMERWRFAPVSQAVDSRRVFDFRLTD